MIINDLDGYYIVFDTKNWNTELDTLTNNPPQEISCFLYVFWCHLYENKGKLHTLDDCCPCTTIKDSILVKEEEMDAYIKIP